MAGHAIQPQDTVITDSNAINIADIETLHEKQPSGQLAVDDSQASIEGIPACKKSETPQPVGEQIQDVEAVQSLEKSGSARSEKPFSTFTLWEKRMIVLVASFGGFLSPLTSNIYFPSLSTISRDLGVSISAVNLTVTTYMIFQGIAPSFLGNFADTTGRRPAYIIGFLIYISSNIGLALNNSYAGLMVLRCVQSAGSSGMVTLMTAVIADVVTSAERGSYIAFTSLGSILGPSISPVIGGLLSQYLGWHSIFWFLAIFPGVFAVLMIVFYPETCRTVVGDGSIPPPTWNKSLLNIHRERQHRKAMPAPNEITLELETEQAVQKKKKKTSFPSPMSTLRICAEKQTSLILFIAAIVYSGYSALVTTLTTQFHAIYKLTAAQQGLVFLTFAVGSIAAAFTNGNLLNRNYRRHCVKTGIPFDKSKQIDMSHFPIERVRLEIGIPFLTAGAVFIILYGWLLDFEVHIAGIIVAMLFMGYCTLAGFNTLSVLIIDTHRANPAAASAASNLVRCLMGAGASAVANPMIERMGRGWCFTFIGLVELACMPTLWAVIRWGPQWRREEAEKERRRREEKETKKRGNPCGKWAPV